MALKPGVVSGEDYITLVNACKEGGYALAAVNCVGTDSVNAVMEAAAKNKSDIIIQLSNGGAQFYAGQGMSDGFQAKVLGAVSAAQHVHLLAEHYGICVVLHTDHANRKLVPWVDALIDHSESHYKATGRPLYTSHMLDLSEESIDDNLSECARMLKRMAPLDMSLEIELGITGGEEDGVGHEIEEGADSSHLYTQPEDVLQAYDLLSPLGHFSVAASFGNVHGVYKPGNVKLRPEILRNSQALVQETHATAANPLNLVFHGGSGSEKAKIAEALTYGVFKMNIDTDTQFAFAESVGKYVMDNARAFKYQIDPEDGTPYKKQYDPRKWLRAGEEGFIARLDEAIADLGSAGKSLAQ
ncbi:class II fructose-bisphosphate aldolase [Paremcibacter congregatus]|uniref:Fructose-bisphosphate aldolase n=1 Tax=Paremcibacter congregatus TaxID=2043170 RepID=A0A2G4YMM3_9PROT|nr:class II fructose-bisphosphate aldolase [Paremcibacter congregatus]PHZ83543.1 class II fructose-bisphosphate aldolase [Paremcibacter congregatus]QDE28371.1 class II fructose-bisphosphate aldolase [Paremcibacter congregatus]|tara:strand:+ start:13075 stop:14142 length:1068 start_codon:yes stop_codon:yes gene_type:complete